MLASALFFTVYHPALVWIPVFTLGVLNALLFNESRKQMAALALHTAITPVVFQCCEWSMIAISLSSGYEARPRRSPPRSNGSSIC